MKRLAIALLILLPLLLLLAIATAWWLLRGSLPELDGELALAGLSAPVTIQRDALGVVTIEPPTKPMRCAHWATCTRRNATSRWT